MQGGHGWGIWQIAPDGGALRPVLSGRFNAISAAISSDGRLLAIDQDGLVSNLLELPIGHGDAAHLFAPSSRQGFSPVYSPDGKEVVFASTRSGSIELWLANSDGSGMYEFSHFKDDAFPLTPSWSPDGKKVVFALPRNGATNLMVGAVDSGTLRQLTFTQGPDFNPVYSTDGHSIYFHSNEGEWNAFGSW
jgi:Tol biopolymer transport system component